MGSDPGGSNPMPLASAWTPPSQPAKDLRHPILLGSDPQGLTPPTRIALAEAEYTQQTQRSHGRPHHARGLRPAHPVAGGSPPAPADQRPGAALAGGPARAHDAYRQGGPLQRRRAAGAQAAGLGGSPFGGVTLFRGPVGVAGRVRGEPQRL